MPQAPKENYIKFQSSFSIREVIGTILQKEDKRGQNFEAKKLFLSFGI
jgi:hypothetical protein